VPHFPLHLSPPNRNHGELNNSKYPQLLPLAGAHVFFCWTALRTCSSLARFACPELLSFAWPHLSLMLRPGMRLSATTLRIAAIFFLVFTCFLFWLPHRFNHGRFFAHSYNETSHHLRPVTATETEAPSTPSFTPPNALTANVKFHESNDDFWLSVAHALEDARPHCPPIVHYKHGLNKTHTAYEPLRPDKPHPQNINMTDDAEMELMREHHTMRTAAFRLAPSLPFVSDTTGIVVTASPKQMSYLLVSLRMLRRTGSKLPVELFLANESEYNATLCETVLPAFNTRCVVMSTIFAPKIRHFQYKIFAILLSSFQNILFLDSDAFPIHDPSPLFSTRPYTSHGLVIWPDIWGNSISSHYYHIAGIPEVPVSQRLSPETGQVMIDKHRHRESLLMMVYYNYYGPSHYYAIFSQGNAGPGDKDTFVPGAIAVDLPWYQVRTRTFMLGRWKGGQFRMVGMGQRDPAEDFMYGGPVPNHLQGKENWEESGMAGNTGKAAAPQLPRPMFVHQMVMKIRPGLILRPDVLSYHTDDGGWQRMWTAEEDAVKTFGYDAEAVMWEVMEEASCLAGVEPEACDKLKEYRAAVFNG